MKEETPPRAWGRHEQQTWYWFCLGNTPTGVGKTKPRRTTGRKEKKHPHGRGEDGTNPVENCKRLETPPRAWGRQIYCNGIVDSVGNTPTGVGKTFTL